jgi:membrane associated rhomboid family serine protease
MVDSVIFGIIASIRLSTYQGFRNPDFYQMWLFHVGYILQEKQYYRVLSSALLHVNWTHFAVNMFVFYSFSLFLIPVMGVLHFVLMLAGSIVLGSCFSLLVHRNHPEYTAVGFSGATSGAVMASIAFNPHSQLLLFFVLPLKGWVAGVLFMCYSLWGIVQQRDNIGHEAHVGGALLGFAYMLVLRPEVIGQNMLYLLAVSVPLLAILFVVFIRPDWIQRNKGGANDERIREYEPETRIETTEEEIDQIYDKVQQKGIQSLTGRELKIYKQIFK